MSVRAQNLLSLVALAISLAVGGCESLQIGASTHAEPQSAKVVTPQRAG